MKLSKAGKWTAVILSVLLLLSGCGQGEKAAMELDPENPVSIEIWHDYNGPQKTAFDALVTEFNETVGLERGIIVDAYSQGNVSDLIENVIDAAEQKVGSGDIPDVFAAYADTAFQVDQMGLVAELDPYLTEEELAEYIPSYLEEGRIDQSGKLKIFPTAKSTEIMMVNKTDWDKFAEATGATLSQLGTLEGVASIAQKYYEWTDGLTPEPDDGKAFFGRDAMANYFIIGCKQMGMEIFSVKNGQVQLNLDETVIRRLWDNYYVPYINGYFAHYGKFRSDDAKTGDIIALICSTSGAAYFPDQVMTSDTEGYPIESVTLETPIFENGDLVAVQQGAGMVVTKSNAKTEYACTVFLKWFTETQRNIEFSVESGYLPVKTVANDAQKVLSVLEKTEDSTLKESLTKSLPVAIEMVNKCTLYTNKAFQGGTAAREVLEHSMISKAASDLEAIKGLMEGGMSRRDAVAKYNTDENFRQWYQSFQSDLDAAVQ